MKGNTKFAIIELRKLAPNSRMLEMSNRVVSSEKRALQEVNDAKSKYGTIKRNFACSPEVCNAHARGPMTCK